jgi:tetratricopeptide (TPR) repeat protein
LLSLYQGRCLEELGLYEEARREYESRFTEEQREMNDILDRLTKKHRVPLIDVYELLKAASANGIVGYENFFTDAVHLTLDANKLIGAALTDFIRKEGYIRDGAPATSEAPATASPATQAGGPGLARYDTAAASTALAWAAFNTGKVDEALDRGLKAVAQDRAEIQAHLLLGYVYTKLGRLDDARSEWDTMKQIYRDLSRR